MMLKVSDIKQFLYCPRIIYFTYVIPVDKKITRKMIHGKEEHIEFERLEKRRRLKSYKLQEGERRFRTRLVSERLGLEGVLDMHIVTLQGCFPVECKYTSCKPALNHKYQLVAYAMLLEDLYQKPVRCGYLYMIMTKKVYALDITPNARLYVKRLLTQIRRLVTGEHFPMLRRRPGRCQECEFKLYCGDV
ncbi:MAG: CRISPR-associated protein Cas4 [Peptococcaceae bacterium]|nr:CRISPR-associated protein Cas4 [Peptococcaceae bacterium]